MIDARALALDARRTRCSSIARAAASSTCAALLARSTPARLRARRDRRRSRRTAAARLAVGALHDASRASSRRRIWAGRRSKRSNASHSNSREDVVRVLGGRPASGAVNAPTLTGADAERASGFIDLAFRLGAVLPQLFDEALRHEIAIVLQGDLADARCGAVRRGVARRSAAVRHRPARDDRQRVAIAREIGVRYDASCAKRDRRRFAASLARCGGRASHRRHRAAARARGSSRSTASKSMRSPNGAMLVTRHRDVPGMVGRIGTILGDADVNISTMQVARTQRGGDAMMVLDVDRGIGREVLDAIGAVTGIESVRLVRCSDRSHTSRATARPTWNREGRYQGQRESTLTAARARASGRPRDGARAERCARASISSPLARCVADGERRSPQPSARRGNRRRGCSRSLTERGKAGLRAEIERADTARLRAWMDEPASVRFEGGESLDDVAARWLAFTSSLRGEE